MNLITFLLIYAITYFTRTRIQSRYEKKHPHSFGGSWNLFFSLQAMGCLIVGWAATQILEVPTWWMFFYALAIGVLSLFIIWLKQPIVFQLWRMKPEEIREMLEQETEQ